MAEELFPGVTADLAAQGSHLLDQGSDFRILYRSGWSPRKKIGIEFCTFTRPLLETTVRRHLMANSKINLLQGFEVAGLVNEDGTRVNGVRIRPRHHDPNALPEVETLAAELVVDTSGRGSKAPEWLEAEGFARPEETVVDAFWGYATRIYEPVEEYKKEWKSLLLMNRPPYQPRAGIIQPIEGNRWIVTIAGVMHDYPPTDEEGFLQFARSLSTPELYRAIQHARPLSKIWGYRRTENRLRNYEKAAARRFRGARRLGLRLQSRLWRGHDPHRPRGAGAAQVSARRQGAAGQPALPEAGRQAGGRSLGADHRRGSPLAGDRGGEGHRQGEVHALVHRAGDPADPAEPGDLPPVPGGQPHAQGADGAVPSGRAGTGPAAGLRAAADAAQAAGGSGTGVPPRRATATSRVAMRH